MSSLKEKCLMGTADDVFSVWFGLALCKTGK